MSSTETTDYYLLSCKQLTIDYWDASTVRVESSQGDPMRRSLVTALLISLITAAPVMADEGVADENPSTFSFGDEAHGKKGDPTPMAFGGICTILASTPTKAGNELSLFGWQDCEGGLITKQQLDLYLDRCTFEFPAGSGNCITWEAYQGVFLRRIVFFPGFFQVPQFGTWSRVVAAGQYKGRVMGKVWSNIGDGSGSDESPSVFVN